MFWYYEQKLWTKIFPAHISNKFIYVEYQLLNVIYFLPLNLTFLHTQKNAVICRALCTGTPPKCWSTSPNTLYRCSLTTMAQYHTINHFEHSAGILQLKSAYLYIPQMTIATRISSPSFVRVTMRQLATSSLSMGISVELNVSYFLYSFFQDVVQGDVLPCPKGGQEK